MPTARVLIVDDAPTIPALIQVLLMGMGCEFRVAVNGRSALTTAQEFQPDLVISDVEMPELDGYGLCEALRAEPSLRGTSVLMLTGLHDEEARRRGLRAGADGFLTKPVSAPALREAVSRILKDGVPVRA